VSHCYAMEKQTLFADILLPLPLPGYFTYRVPADLNELIQPGIRVVVPFGTRKIYSGLVRRIHNKPPSSFQAKYIISILDENPILFEKQFEFWEWIADYYISTPGEVMNAALPPALKLASETRITLNPDFDGNYENLNEREYLIAEALEIQKTLSVSEVSKITGLQKVFPLIGNLIEKKVVLLMEELENPYRQKLEKFVKLSPEYESEEKLKEAFDYAENKAPRQLEVLVALIKLSGRYQAKQKDVGIKEINTAVKNATGALQALVNKGILTFYKKKVSRFDHITESSGMIAFNEHQEHALQQIKTHWKEKDIVLLHGVTSSGKTEIYIELIKEALAQGKQVLYLLPEIALTTQIIVRIQQHFGDRAGVYHSRFNEMERTEVWNNLSLGGIESLNKKISYQLIVGPRSALFLPFQNLGLIIVDEEHESSYKQHDPAPRYHARDAATWLARAFGAKVLLGSATPAVETYFHAQSGRYGLVELQKRYGGVMMPEILVADIKKDTREKKMKSHLSPLLVNSIQESLDNQKQVILFQNRRGFSLRLECDLCNWIPMCTQCDVSLVYHKHINKLKCHYCGYAITPPSRCPSCASTGITLKGFGTEKIEEELPLLFPDARIKRMDLDTTRAKNAYQRIIQDFEENKIDILVGTQMVSKGLDFENVSVVGILSADSMLSFPDFRAHERAFQMMAQVSGRAGRKNARGKVVIQAYDPWHAVIRQVIDNNYQEMYKNQILERRNFHYPPFFRLITITIIHRDPQVVNNAAEFMAGMLKRKFNKEDILGPEYPLVARIKAQYLKNILVKIDKKLNLNQKKDSLREIFEEFSLNPKWKSVRVKINVDPA
jgi:primosomal protein N' (replication factor Y) (superfamily II helicase)